MSDALLATLFQNDACTKHARRALIIRAAKVKYVQVRLSATDGLLPIFSHPVS